MKKTFFAVALAGTCAVGANAAVTPTAEASFTKVNGCYQIGTVEDLYGFAAIVNGGKKKACGKLTADINVNSGVLNNDMDNLANGTPANIWTPIESFIGILDGANHTISGLYYKASTDAGFIKAVEYGTALIKDLKIRDSYIGADDRAGGFIADIKNSGKAYIDNSSYIGLVTTYTPYVVRLGADDGVGMPGNIAELVGTVSGSGSLVLTNSFVEGRVLPLGSAYKLGGLIGFVQKKCTSNHQQLLQHRKC